MKSTKSSILNGFSGKVGNTHLYKRVVNGVEILQQCPVRKKMKNWDTMPVQNQKFFMAIQNARVSLKNPEIKALYEKVANGFCSPASMYIKDFLKPAVINRVVTTGYFGRVGYCIIIGIENIVPVSSVHITINNPTGEIIESGQAIMQHAGTEWHYVTTRPNPDFQGSVIRIESVDIPGHMVVWSSVL